VTLVAEHAHDLGGERFVEHLDDAVSVSAVRRGDRALLDLLPGPFTECLDVSQEVRHSANGTAGYRGSFVDIGGRLALRSSAVEGR
jgi:hypothetical protein